MSVFSLTYALYIQLPHKNLFSTDEYFCMAAFNKQEMSQVCDQNL